MRQHRVAWPLCLYLLLLWFYSITPVSAEEMILSLLELRRNDVVIQTHWWSCGAAAIATLLTHYYAVPVTEAEILTLVIPGNAGAVAEQTGEQALTMLALKQALQAKGVESKAYRLDKAALYDYFTRGGLPVIMHLSFPRAHFVVGIGIVGDSMAIADPSYGKRLVDWSTLANGHGFTGYVLIPIPANEQIPLVYMRQELVLSHFNHRYTRLTALGGDLHYW